MEQKTLAFQAPGIAAQRPVGGNDPVTWDQDGQGVVAVGLAHGLEGARRPHPRGQLPVRDHLAIGNAAEDLPHFFLKLCPLRAQGKMEGLALAVKILVQLAAGLPEQGDIIVASIVTIDQGGQEIVFREQGQRAYGGIDHGLLHGVLTFLAGTRCL